MYMLLKLMNNFIIKMMIFIFLVIKFINVFIFDFDVKVVIL